MPNISPALHRRVTKRIDECWKIAETHYGSRLGSKPTWDYRKRGKTAGVAQITRNHMTFNGTLLVENEDEFIARTVGHEVAHIVDYQLNGVTYKWNRGRRVQDHHGRNWAHIMVQFGQEPSRCHSFDTTNSTVRRANNRVKYVWTCGCGGGEVVLGAKRHARQLAAPPGMGFYQRGHTARRCGNYTHTHMEQNGARTPVGSSTAPAPQRPAAKPAPVRRRRTSGRSKLQMCRDLWDSSKSRQEMIRIFVRDAGCTPAGAATYYAKLNKESGR